MAINDTDREWLNTVYEKWPQGLDTANATPNLCSEFINTKMKEYELFKFMDTDLWESFQGDFHNWQEKDFKAVSTNELRQFRSFLRSRGVWVAANRTTTIAVSLANTVNEDNPSQWSQSELRTRTKEDFVSPRIIRHYTNLFEPGQDLSSSQQQAKELAQMQEKIAYLESKVTEPSSSSQSESGPSNKGKDVDNSNDKYTDTDKGKGKGNDGPDYSREITSLSKMYTDEMKYSGEKDNFDYKLDIFHDLCKKVNIMGDEGRMLAFSTMLKEPALEFYYSISKFIAIYKGVCTSMRNNFEGAEHKSTVLEQWNDITLRKMMEDSQGKTVDECFQKLLRRMRFLHHGLPPTLQSDEFFYNKLLISCQDVPACSQACYNPSTSVIGLVNNLTSSIRVWEKVNKAEPTQQIFFTDRRYHKPFRNLARPLQS